MKNLSLMIILGALCACGQTFDSFPKLSGADVAEPATAAAPPPAEAATVARVAEADVVAQDALPDLLNQISDQVQTNAGAAPTDAVVTPPQQSRGQAPKLFGWLRDRALPAQTVAEGAAAADASAAVDAAPQGAADVVAEVAQIADVAEVAAVAPQPNASLDGQTAPVVVAANALPETAEQTAEQTAATPAPAAAPVATASLFGLFRRTPAAPEPSETAAAPAPSQADAVVTQAAVQAPTDTTRRGFSLRRNKPPTGPDKDEIAFGTSIPYGAIARVCDASSRKLGKQVDRYPARGSGYKLYDSNPSATTLRPHYVTGFKDGCVRQFTAATATFGTTVGHERVRYMNINKSIPFSATDKAYETLKQRECRVGANKPCEGRRADKFHDATVFITAYGSFGRNVRWHDILLHDGAVVEKSYKSR